MPTVAVIDGIKIEFYFDEHPPPHFHAKYGDDEAVIEIDSGKVSGSMSNRALSLVQEWRKVHREELIRDWKLAEQKKALFPIKPLE